MTPVGDIEEAESWEMEARPDGGCAFRSTKHKRYLAWKEDEKVTEKDAANRRRATSVAKVALED